MADVGISRYDVCTCTANRQILPEIATVATLPRNDIAEQARMRQSSAIITEVSFFTRIFSFRIYKFHQKVYSRKSNL